MGLGSRGMSVMGVGGVLADGVFLSRESLARNDKRRNFQIQTNHMRRRAFCVGSGLFAI